MTPTGFPIKNATMQMPIRHLILRRLILPVVGLILLLGVGTSGYHWLER